MPEHDLTGDQNRQGRKCSEKMRDGASANRIACCLLSRWIQDALPVVNKGDCACAAKEGSGPFESSGPSTHTRWWCVMVVRGSRRHRRGSRMLLKPERRSARTVWNCNVEGCTRGMHRFVRPKNVWQRAKPW